MDKVFFAATHNTASRQKGRHIALAVFLAASLLGSVAPARANNIVTNGSFDLTTLTGSQQPTYGTGTGCTGGSLEDWCEGDGGTAGTTNNGTNALSLLYFAGTQAESVTDTFGANNFSLWQGITHTIPNSSPSGGNFLVVDGGSGYNLSIYQTISGLTSGASYQLSFYQAAGQQNGKTGATTEQWQVTFGTQTLDSTLQSNPSEDFQPWTLQTMTFKATSTSQILSFLALGTPNGVPPMVFLDGVSMAQVVPEPSSLAIAGLGLCALLVARRLRRV